MKSWLAVLFGEVADRERRHPSEGVSGHLGASGKEASGIRGARVLGRKVARAFLGLLTLGPGHVGAVPWQKVARAFLGGLTLGPSPVGAVPGRKCSLVFLGRLILGPGFVGAIGMGRLARGTEPRPMVPIMPPFFLSRRKIILDRKKRTSLTVIL